MRRRSVSGTLFGLLLVLAAAAAGYWYFLRAPSGVGSQPQAAEQAAPRAVYVETEPVRTGTVIRNVSAVGTLQSNESVMISPEIAGRIVGIHFREGERVEKGARLISLDDSVVKAELAEREARLTLSQRNNARSAELFERKVATARTRDEAMAAVLTGQAEVTLAKARLDKTRIVAPFEGVLGLRRVSVGDYVNPGQEMVNLEDIDPIKVDFRIPAPSLSLLREGQAIEVQVDAFPGETFSGEVYAMDPRIDEAGRSIALRARIPNPDHRLLPGLFARVNLIVERRENAMLIPEQAVVPQENRTVVFKAVDGKAVQTEVRLGQRRAGKVEILSGLAPGDIVISAGQMKLRNGTPIIVQQPAGA